MKHEASISFSLSNTHINKHQKTPNKSIFGIFLKTAVGSIEVINLSVYLLCQKINRLIILINNKQIKSIKKKFINKLFNV